MIADIPTGSWIVLLAAAVGWYSTLDYAVATAAGRLRPSLSSWGVWTVTAAIGTAAAWSAGSTVGVVISAATCLRCAQVLVPAAAVDVRERVRAARGLPPRVAAEPHSRSQRLLDVGCLAACAAIGIIWQVTDDPVLALVLSIAVDGIACLPTIWHGVHGQEHPKPFLLGMVGPLIALLVVRERVLSDYAWPLYELLVNILMVLPPLIVGWPGGSARPAVRAAAAPVLGGVYLVMALLVFTVIPPPGGQWPPGRAVAAWVALGLCVVAALVLVVVAAVLARQWVTGSRYVDPPTVELFPTGDVYRTVLALDRAHYPPAPDRW